MSKETITEKATRLICQRRVEVIFADDRRAEVKVEGDTFMDTGDEADIRTVKLYQDGSEICDCPNTLFVEGKCCCSHVIAAKRLWRPKGESVNISLKELNTMLYGDDTIIFD